MAKSRRPINLPAPYLKRVWIDRTRATLLRMAKYGLEPAKLEDTDHYRLMREFFAGPQAFLDAMMED